MVIDKNEKLIFDGFKRFSLWERLKFLVWGDIRLRLWTVTKPYGPKSQTQDFIKFSIQSKKLNGEWDEENECC